MREELLGVGAHPGHLLRRRFPARCACILAGRVAQTGAGHELPHRLLRPVAAVGVVYVLDLGAHLRAIWQQFDHRRFVGDQRTHLAGVGGDQREPDNDATAAAEDVGRLPPSADSRRCTSSACCSGVTSWAVSSRLLLPMPRGSYVTTL